MLELGAEPRLAAEAGAAGGAHVHLGDVHDLDRHRVAERQVLAPVNDALAAFAQHRAGAIAPHERAFGETREVALARAGVPVRGLRPLHLSVGCVRGHVVLL